MLEEIEYIAIWYSHMIQYGQLTTTYYKVSTVIESLESTYNNKEQVVVIVIQSM